MEIETVEHSGRLHVVKKGVESTSFLVSEGDSWAIYYPVLYRWEKSLEEASKLIINRMDAWYTVTEAAARLVELGKADRPAAAQTMYRWLRAGRFPGAVRAGVGRSGGWRIPEAALREFERKGGEKK